jgi:hypothetical protein
MPAQQAGGRIRDGDAAAAWVAVKAANHILRVYGTNQCVRLGVNVNC